MKIKKLSKKVNKFLLIAMSLAGTLLVVDTYKNWRTVSPAHITSAEAPAMDKKEITITSKAYSSDESKTFLGTDLIDKGYQPVEISIQNNSSRSYQLSSDKITLPSASANKMARAVTKSTIPRAIGYKVASLFFWPFAIPGTIDGLKTFKSHQQLKRDLSAKGIKKEVILPYSTLTRVIFVPKAEYKSNFEITLLNEETGKPVLFAITN